MTAYADDQVVRDEGDVKTADAPSRRFRRLPIDLAPIIIYWLYAGVVASRLLLKPSVREVNPNAQDQIFFEWLLAHGARVVTHLENPLFTDRMNAPDGVNLMANTSALGITIPLAPVTLLVGPEASYALWVTSALALTAIAWFFFLNRGLNLSRLAAFIGGAFCGFAPGMISHLHGQPNISSLFVVPLILWCVKAITSTTRPVRLGAILGLLVTYQAFVNEEILFVTAWVCAIMAIAYAAFRWSAARALARRFFAVLGVAGVVAAVLLAYPLWFQFFGPQHYRALPHQFQNHVADLGSYSAYSIESLGGPRSGSPYSLTPVENNSFFGWPLLAVIGLIVWWCWKNLLVRLAAVVAAFFAIMSLGAELYYARQPTGIPGPWGLLASIPPFSMVVPTRLALVVTAAVGVLLAASVDQLAVRTSEPATWNGRGRQYRWLWVGALVAVLVPVVPGRLDVSVREPVPTFITSGSWREYVDDDQTLVPLPVPSSRETSLAGMTWAASAGLGFRIPHGYFLGPDATSRTRLARFGANPTAFSQTMFWADKQFQAPEVTTELRNELIADLNTWNAAVVVVSRTDKRAGVYRTIMEQVAGPARAVDDVWLWDVRPLVSGDRPAG